MAEGMYLRMRPSVVIPPHSNPSANEKPGLAPYQSPPRKVFAVTPPAVNSNRTQPSIWV